MPASKIVEANALLVVQPPLPISTHGHYLTNQFLLVIWYVGSDSGHFEAIVSKEMGSTII